MADKASENFGSGGFGWRYILFVTTMVVLVVVLPFTLSDAPPIFSENPLQTTSIVVNILLTSTIIWFYRYSAISSQNQVDLQENQTEIMDRQTELMEAQSAARIQFEGVQKVEGDDVYIQLSNIGESAAEDLKLVTEFEFESDRYGTELGHWPLRRVEKENENRPNFLDPGERHALFTSHVPVQFVDTEEEYSSLREFSTTMTQLHGDGVEECEVTLFLLGGDLIDEASAQQIWHETIKVNEAMDFEDAYRQHYI